MRSRCIWSDLRKVATCGYIVQRYTVSLHHSNIEMESCTMFYENCTTRQIGLYILRALVLSVLCLLPSSAYGLD